jgi:hypothetical protein
VASAPSKARRDKPSASSVPPMNTSSVGPNSLDAR